MSSLTEYQARSVFAPASENFDIISRHARQQSYLNSRNREKALELLQKLTQQNKILQERIAASQAQRKEMIARHQSEFSKLQQVSTISKENLKLMKECGFQTTCVALQKVFAARAQQFSFIINMRTISNISITEFKQKVAITYSLACIQQEKYFHGKMIEIERAFDTLQEIYGRTLETMTAQLRFFFTTITTSSDTDNIQFQRDPEQYISFIKIRTKVNQIMEIRRILFPLLVELKTQQSKHAQYLL